MTLIRGSGGGGKGGGGGSARAPVESPDSLRSRQYARILDVTSEGEIEGLVDGLKSVYLDDTPIQNADGSFNFTGVTLAERTGAQTQDYIPGFQSVEAENAVSVAVKYGVPVVRSISNQNADAVRITVSVPQLTVQDITNGDISGTSVAIAIDIQTDGSGYVEKVNDTISGKTTSRYQRAYRIELDGNGPWDIRVRRLTADSTSSALQNATYWDSYTEIVDAKLTYPNSALIGISVYSDGFQTIPRRGYEMKGIKVRIPSNYDPITRAYTGVWDGTFTVAWTDNPAWCFYDLLISERYGLGAFIDASQVDKWNLYQIAQYCDELVDDGFGGVEPRFTCSLYLQTREEAYNVINTFAAVFCGQSYWSGGSIVTTQDSPFDPVALFTPANVINTQSGCFSYSGSSIKSRHTVALVSWNDPEDRYRQKIEYVEDAEGIERYGVIQTEVVAIGCTSRGQAHRYGRRILYAERMETEVISFRTGLDGLSVAPGEIIQTTDPVRAGVRMGGRILSATTSSVVLDAEVTLEAGSVYTLWVTLPDGSVESRSVTTGVGNINTLNVSPDFSAAPQEMAIWVLAATNLTPETWRVISVAETDQTQAEITALAYRADKYAAIEQGLILESLQTSRIDLGQAAPTDFIFAESLYLVSAGVVGTRITASWSGTGKVYELQYRRAGNNWVTTSSSNPSIDIQPAHPGTYEFILTAVNAIGRRSQSIAASKIIYGKLSLPSGVSNFNLAAISGTAHLSFSPSADLDVIVGGHLRVRHTPNILTPEWSNAIDIGPQIPGNATTAALPLIEGTYLAKWVDSSGNESAAPSGIITNAPSVIGFNVQKQINEAPTFSGIKTSVGVLQGFLTLESSQKISERLDPIIGWERLSALGGVSSTGEYLFASSVDLGSVQTSRVTASLSSFGFDALQLISYRPNVSTWPSVSGDLITDVYCQIQIRTTDDDPEGSPIWGDWNQLIVGDYTSRAFQFKAVLSSSYITHNIQVSGLSVTVDMPDRIEQGNDIASGTGVYSVIYTMPFMGVPALGITAQDLSTGDYWVLTNKTRTGFSVAFKNAAGAGISRTFDYIAKGY